MKVRICIDILFDYPVIKIQAGRFVDERGREEGSLLLVNMNCK